MINQEIITVNKWNEIPNEDIIEKTISALKLNGIDVIVVQNKEEAKDTVLSLIPENSEVMTMTSVTLDSMGINETINKSGNYNSIKDKMYSMDRSTQKMEMKKIGSAHDFVIGSVHAITEDGKVVVVSNTGSQLPAYSYGAGKVIWVAGAQKIVLNLNEAMKRIEAYVLPLESERARKAYGVAGSAINKILIFNKEVEADRITLIIVKEKLGF